MLWSIFISVYVCISLFAAYKTYHEQKRRRISSPLFDLIGYVLCVLWPLTLGAMVIAARMYPKGAELSRLD